MGNSKINKLLSKKGWTGAEVGKALIASVIHDAKHIRDPQRKPLFSQSDFDKMEESIKSEKDYAIYAVYRDLYDGLIDAYNRGLCNYQQFNNGYFRHCMMMREAQFAEIGLQQAESSPYIMTESQYKAVEERTVKRLRSHSECFISLLFGLLETFVENIETAPEAIREAIEATKKEPATNKRVLSAYIDEWGEGYYQLPDGTRSDQTSSEEWIAKLQEDFMQRHRLFIGADIEEAKKYCKREFTFRCNELLFYGIDAVKALHRKMTGEELPQEYETVAMQSIEGLLDYRGYFLQDALKNGKRPRNPEDLLLLGIIADYPGAIAEWHTYSEPPAGFTKYDILEYCTGFYDSSRCDSAVFSEFLEDYPGLFVALEDYIKQSLKKAETITPDQYGEPLATWGELADMGCFNGGYRDLVTASIYDIQETIGQEAEEDGDCSLETHLKIARIAVSGIAIEKAPQPFRTTESGEYADKWKPFADVTGISDIYGLAQSEASRTELSDCVSSLMVPALRYLQAFNTLVDIIGTVYDIENIAEVKIKSVEYAEELCSASNCLLYSLHATVYGSEEEKKRKRELVREIFTPIDYFSLRPTEEAIEAVTKELSSLGFGSEARKKLKKFDSLIEKLSGGGNGIE